MRSIAVTCSVHVGAPAAWATNISASDRYSVEPAGGHDEPDDAARDSELLEDLHRTRHRRL